MNPKDSFSYMVSYGSVDPTGVQSVTIVVTLGRPIVVFHYLLQVTTRHNRVTNVVRAMRSVGTMLK